MGSFSNSTSSEAIKLLVDAGVRIDKSPHSYIVDYHTSIIFNCIVKQIPYDAIETLLTHPSIANYFSDVIYRKNPLLHACVYRNFEEVEKILATDTNLMNEGVFLVNLIF